LHIIPVKPQRSLSASGTTNHRAESIKPVSLRLFSLEAFVHQWLYMNTLKHRRKRLYQCPVVVQAQILTAVLLQACTTNNRRIYLLTYLRVTTVQRPH